MRRAWHWVFPAGGALIAVVLLVMTDSAPVRILAASGLVLLAAGSVFVVRDR